MDEGLSHKRTARTFVEDLFSSKYRHILFPSTIEEEETGQKEYYTLSDQEEGPSEPRRTIKKPRLSTC